MPIYVSVEPRHFGFKIDKTNSDSYTAVTYTHDAVTMTPAHMVNKMIQKEVKHIYTKTGKEIKLVLDASGNIVFKSPSYYSWQGIREIVRAGKAPQYYPTAVRTLPTE